MFLSVETISKIPDCSGCSAPVLASSENVDSASELLAVLLPSMGHLQRLFIVFLRSHSLRQLVFLRSTETLVCATKLVLPESVSLPSVCPETKPEASVYSGPLENFKPIQPQPQPPVLAGCSAEPVVILLSHCQPPISTPLVV